MNEPNLPPDQNLPESAVRRRLLAGLGLLGVAVAAPVGLYRYLGSRPSVSGLPQPLRRVLETNAQLAKKLFSPAHLAPTYPMEKAVKKARINGRIGLKTPIPPDWQLRIEQPNTQPLHLSLETLKTLPKHELVFEFKCVEGWSQIQHWGGARLSDLLHTYRLGIRENASLENPNAWFNYVGLETPDGAYYVGLDMPSALHPQTLLAYELNGEPISAEHGAPLRLMIPVKYGIKSLKRIGRIFFSDTRPRDYWAERGYDYDSGL